MTLRYWIARRRGWTRRRPLLAALVLVLAVAVPGYWRLDQIVADAADTNDRLAAFVVESSNATCESRADFREVLRNLVLLSDDGSGLNLSAIPSFAELPQTVKTYLLDLEAASESAPNPSEFVTRALALLEPVPCPDPSKITGEDPEP